MGYIMMTLKDYFKKSDYLILDFNDKYHIFIDNISGLCIEICDNIGNSINIGCYVNISYNTYVDDIKDIVSDYILDKYFNTII